MELKEAIKEKGLTIGFLESKMELPKNTLYNYINGSKDRIPVKHMRRVKRILRKHKINTKINYVV